jgi:hypothetical protein
MRPISSIDMQAWLHFLNMSVFMYRRLLGRIMDCNAYEIIRLGEDFCAAVREHHEHITQDSPYPNQW